MKIFVGYGYNPRDTWVEDLVFPLIQSFGDTVASGKEIYGQNLDAGVKGEIAASDALLGFSTRRDPTANAGIWTTHLWVRDELLTAANAHPVIPFVEIRETQVEPQTGMLEGRARIIYDESQRDRCLVEIATAIGRWHRARELYANFQLELLPDNFLEEIRPLLQDANLRCIYRVLRKDEMDADADQPTALRKLRGRRVAIYTRPVPRDAMIQVEVWRGQNSLLWTSDWQAVESRIINLEKPSL